MTSTAKRDNPITKRGILELLGRVSVLFSTLEAALGDLLCMLSHPEEPLLAVTLLERTPFARTLDLLAAVGRFKDAATERRISNLLAVVKPLRKKRNLFVHGCWDLSPKLLEHGLVVVSDSRIKFESADARMSWQKGQKHTLKFADLEAYQLEVMRGLKLSRELIDLLQQPVSEGKL